MWEGWTKNIYLGLRDQPSLMTLGVFGAVLAIITSLFLPVWPLLGFFWFLNGGSWMALTVIIESLLLWAFLIYVRARVAIKMKFSPWYSFTIPLGAAVFGAMMFVSAQKVISRKGVTWRGRTYQSK